MTIFKHTSLKGNNVQVYHPGSCGHSLVEIGSSKYHYITRYCFLLLGSSDNNNKGKQQRADKWKDFHLLRKEKDDEEEEECRASKRGRCENHKEGGV